jgi:membrane protein implicated in regulation of membrane protease activity
MAIDVGLLLRPQDVEGPVGCLMVLATPFILLLLLIMPWMLLGTEDWPTGVAMIAFEAFIVLLTLTLRRRWRRAREEAERERQRVKAQRAERRIERRSMSTTEKALGAGSAVAAGAAAAGRVAGRGAKATVEGTPKAVSSFKAWRRQRKQQAALWDEETVADAKNEGLLD